MSTLRTLQKQTLPERLDKAGKTLRMIGETNIASLCFEAAETIRQAEKRVVAVMRQLERIEK